MGTLAQKLEYLAGTKAAIKTAIESTGATVPAGTTFRGYASIISNLSGGGGGGGNGELEAALEAADAACVDSDIDMMLLENENYIGFGFLYTGFGIESYNSETSEFSARNWIYVSYNKTTGEWNTNDWSSSTSEGGNFINNIKYCNLVLTYNGIQLWPEVNTVAVGPNVLRTVTANADTDLTAGEGVVLVAGSERVYAGAPIGQVSGIPHGIDFGSDMCAVAHENAPYISIYDTTTTPWTRLENPDILPGGSGYEILLGSYCIVGHRGRGSFIAYDITTTPWTKLEINPMVGSPGCPIHGITYVGRFCVMVGGGNSSEETDLVYVYNTETSPWPRIATLLPDMPGGIAYDATTGRDRLVVAYDRAPYIEVFDTSSENPRNWTTVGSPTAHPTGAAYTVKYNANGSRCVVAHENAPYITIYDTYTSTFTWTKLEDPDTLPTGAAHGVAFSPNSLLCAVAHENAPYISIYDTTTTPWTKLEDPDILPTDMAVSVSFSPSGLTLAVGSQGTSNLLLYNVSYGTPLAISANGAISSVNGSYGYATENIAQDSSGSIAVLFD